MNKSDSISSPPNPLPNTHYPLPTTLIFSRGESAIGYRIPIILTTLSTLTTGGSSVMGPKLVFRLAKLSLVAAVLAPEQFKATLSSVSRAPHYEMLPLPLPRTKHLPSDTQGEGSNECR